MFDARSMVHDEESRDEYPRFSIDAALLYPTMVDRIVEFLNNDDERLPRELVDATVRDDIDPHQAARMYSSRAKSLGVEGVRMALIAADECSPKAKAVASRAEALELCRMWFTRALKNAVGLGQPFTLHIGTDANRAYRLKP